MYLQGSHYLSSSSIFQKKVIRSLFAFSTKWGCEITAREYLKWWYCSEYWIFFHQRFHSLHWLGYSEKKFWKRCQLQYKSASKDWDYICYIIKMSVTYACITILKLSLMADEWYTIRLPTSSWLQLKLSMKIKQIKIK